MNNQAVDRFSLVLRFLALGALASAAAGCGAEPTPDEEATPLTAPRGLDDPSAATRVKHSKLPAVRPLLPALPRPLSPPLPSPRPSTLPPPPLPLPSPTGDVIAGARTADATDVGDIDVDDALIRDRAAVELAAEIQNNRFDGETDPRARERALR